MRNEQGTRWQSEIEKSLGPKRSKAFLKQSSTLFQWGYILKVGQYIYCSANLIYKLFHFLKYIYIKLNTLDCVITALFNLITGSVFIVIV
jgi:hypothetical protein